MKKTIFFLMILFLLVPAYSFAEQDGYVTIIVKSTDGVPVAGAKVRIILKREDGHFKNIALTEKFTDSSGSIGRLKVTRNHDLPILLSRIKRTRIVCTSYVFSVRVIASGFKDEILNDVKINCVNPETVRYVNLRPDYLGESEEIVGSGADFEIGYDWGKACNRGCNLRSVVRPYCNNPSKLLNFRKGFIKGNMDYWHNPRYEAESIIDGKIRDACN